MANARHGHFVWYEHLTMDATSAIDFYGEVVGWKTQPEREQNVAHRTWLTSEGPLGGVTSMPRVCPQWIGHVCVMDIDETVATVKRLGGKVYEESDVPTMGRFAVLADPQGATFAVFEPDGAIELHAKKNEGEFCWNELMTTDLNAAFDFYEEVFGWKALRDMKLGRLEKYRVFGIEAGEQLGGILTIPKGTPMPTSWLYYVQVGDLEAALGRAIRQRARVLCGPLDIPGGGKIVQCLDPQGAAFALHQSPPILD